MDMLGHSQPVKTNHYRTIAGVLLILAGGVLFLDRYLKTGWLSLIVLPAVGLFLYLWGTRVRHLGLIITGSLVGGIGAGSMAAWGPAVRFSGPGSIVLASSPHVLIAQLGMLAFYFGVGWLVVVITSAALTPTPAWWAMVPGGVIGALGYCLLFSPLRWVDFVFYPLLGVALPLLLWGIITRLMGLVIPGCLLLGIAPGIYLAWRSPSVGNGLTQTGVMLVWFAIGWFMITAAGRYLNHKYVWWPLIPGGILAMVGTGLYIGGDPSHALGFIGNTGSIALIIFGLYLLLLRKGIHH